MNKNTLNEVQGRIFNAFKRLGLSAHETRVYLSLLLDENSSGYQLSKQSNVPTSKIYQVVERLLEAGLIVATDTRPVKYFACPPEDVLNKLEEEYSVCIINLKKDLKFFKNGKGIYDHLAWNIPERREIISKAKEAISQSKNDIFLAAWHEDLKAIRNVLTASEKRSVKINIVCYGKTTIDCGVVYSHRATDYPHRERGERRFALVVDKRVAVIASFGNEAAGGLYTNNSGLVHLIRDFIIHEIYIILIERAYPREVFEVVGKDWEKVRIRPIND
jgi:HTH-type transcriptional regulator, sugar sensing transcriptional regulator